MKLHTVDNDKLLIRITSCPGHDSPKSASLRWGTWDKSPISTATKNHLLHGLKQQTLSIMDTQQDLTSRIKRFQHQGYAGFKGGFQAFLGNYCLLSIWVLMVQLLAQD